MCCDTKSPPWRSITTSSCYTAQLKSHTGFEHHRTMSGSIINLLLIMDEQHDLDFSIHDINSNFFQFSGDITIDLLWPDDQPPSLRFKVKIRVKKGQAYIGLWEYNIVLSPGSHFLLFFYIIKWTNEFSNIFIDHNHSTHMEQSSQVISKKGERRDLYMCVTFLSVHVALRQH